MLNVRFQHTAIVLEAYFKLFDNVVHRMHLIDSNKCPWKTWREVPPHNIYNYDKIGPNPNKHHAPSIIGIETMLHDKINWLGSGTGNKTPSYHATLGITTQAAGNYCVPGKGTLQVL